MKTGPLNLITDVAGLHVGNAEDSRLRSGVTAVLFEQAAVAAVDVRGGGPGTRETDLLAPENTVLRWYFRRLRLWARRSSRRTGAPARAGPHTVNHANRRRR
jgi:Peptidase family S58